MQYKENEFEEIIEIAKSIINSRLILKNIDEITHRYYLKNLMNKQGVFGWAPFFKNAIKASDLAIFVDKKRVYYKARKHTPLNELEILMENLPPAHRNNIRIH